MTPPAPAPAPADADPPGSAPDSVGRSLSWTLFGELGYAAAQFLALVIITKLGSQEALGRFSLGLALATPVVVLAQLHLRPIYVVDVRSRWGFADYLGLRTALMPVALLVSLAVCLARGWPAETTTVVMLVAVIRVAEGFSDIYYARAQRAETMTPIGVSRAVRGLAWMVLLPLGLLVGDELLALALIAAATIAQTFGFDRRKAGQIRVPDDPSGTSTRPRFDRRALAAITREALPMGVAAGLLGLSANVPAYVLEDHAGVAAVGVLAAVLSVRQASGVLNLALGNAAIARLAKLSVDDARGFWILLAKLLGLVAILNGVGVAAVVWVGDLYLRVAYTPEYAAYLPELIVTSVAALVLGLANILSQTITALSQFRLQLWINAVVLILSVVASLWWIPARGLGGAAEVFLALACVRLVIYVAANAWLGPRAVR